ncbi:MAG: DNA internalization-related competence protein ComEC/Rec2 [Syntrophomonadaceae bacterium]|nr:DNA internalization-related competence protein ComEC/Rec2 [Syntrophomonadaceae bacterium]
MVISHKESEQLSFSYIPIVALLGLAGGIGVCEWGNLWWLLGILMLLAAVGIWKEQLLVLVPLLFLVGGFAYWNVVHPVHPDRGEGYLPATELIVLERPQTRDDQLRFLGWLPEENLKVRVFLGDGLKVSKGDVLKVRGSLRELKGASNPGEFDYREFWAHRGVFFNLIIKDASAVEYKGNQLNIGQIWLEKVIGSGSRAIRANMTDEQAVLLEGMLFGFQGEISDEQFSDFQKSGLVHIFSVSGFHVGFILLIGIWAANRLSNHKGYRFMMVAGLLVLYGFMTGWPSPMIRASLMAVLGLTAHYLGRDEDLITSLAVAGLVILLINPANLFEISFQLSFTATVGIILFYPRLKEIFRPRNKWHELALLSLAPQAASLPIACYYFNLVSLISVAANIVLAYAAGGAVILGFLGVAAAQFSQWPAAFFMIPAGFLTALVQWGAKLLGGIPGGFLWVAKPEVWMIILAYLGMAFWWLQPGKGLRWLLGKSKSDGEGNDHDFRAMKREQTLGICLLCLFAILIVIPGHMRNPGALRVVFLDVGQGDSIFIKTPGGYTILVDGGGSEFTDVGQKVVLPYLRRQGIRRLDMIVATHPHTDHLEGLKSVLRELPVGVVVAGRGCFANNEEAGGRLLVLEGARFLSPDSLTRMWLWAPYEDESPEIGNETSVICKIGMGDVDFLLTGDAGVFQLELLLEKQYLNLSSNVLKMPHHGSRYSWSSGFIEAVDPGYGVVCAGAGNTFGHPDPQVMEGMRTRGSQVFRTDIDGAVTFLTRGQKMRIELFK